MIDLHAHVLPGLDDGPQHMAHALEMCRIAVERGTSALVATPHMFDGAYDVTRNQILAGVSELRRALVSEDVALEVFPGGDVHAHIDLVALVKAGEVMTVGDGGKYLMVEFDHLIVPSHVDQMLFSLRLFGLTPIITHPERNLEVQRNVEVMSPLVRAGNLVQVTPASLVGGFGPDAGRCAKELVLRRMAHVVASDAHSVRGRPPGLARAKSVLEDLVGIEKAQEMLMEYPQKILDGEDVSIPEPLEKISRRRRILEWLKW